MNELKVGDKVKLKGNPRELPDPNSVGVFNIDDVSRVYTISRADTTWSEGAPIYELEEDRMKMWFCHTWLIRSNKIYLGGE